MIEREIEREGEASTSSYQLLTIPLLKAASNSERLWKEREIQILREREREKECEREIVRELERAGESVRERERVRERV